MLAMIGRTIFPAAFRKGGRDRGVGGPDGGLERRPTSAGSFADARRAPDRLPRAPGALSLRGCLKTNRALIDHTCARDDSGRSETDRRVRQAQCPRKNRWSGLVANQTKLAVILYRGCDSSQSVRGRNGDRGRDILTRPRIGPEVGNDREVITEALIVDN
jgi:hypothetical protein